MKITTIEQTQIFYEIAMGIGASLDLKQMLSVSLNTIFRKLNCSAGVVFQSITNNDDTIQFKPAHSIPRLNNIQRNIGYQTALKKIKKKSLTDTVSFFKKLPLKMVSKDQKIFTHIFELPGFGLFLLIKNDEDLNPFMRQSLRPILKKLADACISCIQNDAMEKAHQQAMSLNHVLNQKTREFESSQKVLLNIMSDIQQTKKAFIESEDRYRSLVENITVGIYQNTGGPYGRFLQANAAMAKIFGYDSVNAFLKTPVISLYQNAKDRKQLVDELQKKGHIKDKELKMKKKDGTIIWVSCTAKAQFNQNEDIQHINGIIEDITEQKAAKEALLKAHNFSESIIETAQAIILILDKKGHIVRFNQYMEDLSGYTLDEVKGKNWFEIFINTDERDQIKKIFKTAINKIKTQGNINAINTKSGEKRLIEWHDKRLTNIDGSTHGLLVIGHDVTEQINAKNELQSAHNELETRIKDRTRVEKALKASELKFRSVVENSPTGIFIIDDQFKITYFNDEVMNITKYSAEELQDQDFRRFLAKESLKLVTDRYLSRQKGIKNLPTRYEIFIRRKDGKKRCLEISSAIIMFDLNSKMTISQVMDITKRKLLEQKLNNHMKRLEDEVKQRTNELIQVEKMASIGQLVAGVAHEINNPLAYMKSTTHFIHDDLKQLIKRSPENTLFIKDILNNLKTNAEGISRIETITKILKRFSKPDTSKKELADINQGIKDTLLIIHNDIKNRIEIIEDYQKIDKVRCHIGQLNQVFMNVIQNASQSMTNGQLMIQTKQKRSYVIITFKDTGVGIPKKDLNRIFDPFFTTKQHGTGLGLSVSYRIIKDHNGDIIADSTEDIGTTITIKLPINKK